MSLPVLIMGRSGSGKTYSIKKFSPDKVGVISVEKGRLPFQKPKFKVVRVPDEFDEDIKTYAQLNAARYAWVENTIKYSRAKSIVIDDSQFLMVNELFDRSHEKGYDKFTDMAANFRELVHFVNHLPDDEKIVYFLHHSETDANSREKAKTVGRMLDEKLVLEGCFDIVIYCEDQKFFTQGNGMSSAKTPEGMFDSMEIPNDLKAVDDAIRAYYKDENDETSAKE